LLLCVTRFYSPKPVRRKTHHVVEVILPTLPYPLVATPICILVAVNLIMHYYYACTVPPGFVDAPPQKHGIGFLWARQPDSVARGEDPIRMKIIPASMARCRKCNVDRPEVRQLVPIQMRT
jgi:palmitoyltransferase